MQNALSQLIHATVLGPSLPWKYARTLAMMLRAASFEPGGSSLGGRLLWPVSQFHYGQSADQVIS